MNQALKALESARKAIDNIWCLASERSCLEIETLCEQEAEKLDELIVAMREELKKQMEIF